MPMLVAADATTRDWGLLIDVHPELERVDESLLFAFCRRLRKESLFVGLFVTRRETVVVRDTGLTHELTRDRFKTQVVDTADLFARARIGAPLDGGGFVMQVERWLAVMATSWHTLLAPAAIEAMVPSVVGHLVGSVVYPLDDEDVAAAE